MTKRRELKKSGLSLVFIFLLTICTAIAMPSLEQKTINDKASMTVWDNSFHMGKDKLNMMPDFSEEEWDVCFQCPESNLCMKSYPRGSLYTKYLDDGSIKFGYDIEGKRETSEKAFLLYNQDPREAGCSIDYSDFDEMGYEYSDGKTMITIDNPGDWLDPIIGLTGVSSSTQYNSQRKIVQTSTGNIYAIWMDASGGDLNLSKSSDNGVTFSILASLNDSVTSASMAIDSNDIIHASIQTEGIDDLVYVQWNASDDSLLGTLLLVDGTANTESFQNDIAILNDNTVGISYQREDGATPRTDIKFKQCSENCLNLGNWTSEITIADASADFNNLNQNQPDLETDGTNWFTVWYGQSTAFPTTYQVWYSNSSNGTAWESGENVNGLEGILRGPASLIVKDNIPMIIAREYNNSAVDYVSISFNKRESGSWNGWVSLFNQTQTTVWGISDPSLSTDGTNLFAVYKAFTNETINISTEDFDTPNVDLEISYYRGWEANSAVANVEVTIVNKELKLYDNNAGSLYTIQNLLKEQTIERIDLKIKSDDVSLLSKFQLQGVGSGDAVITIQLDNDQLQYVNGGTTNVMAVSDNTWYNISLRNISFTTDTYDIWVDDVSKKSGAVFNTAGSTIGEIVLLSSSGDFGYTTYYDDIIIYNATPSGTTFQYTALYNSTDNGDSWTKQDSLNLNAMKKDTYSPGLSYQYGYTDTWNVSAIWTDLWDAKYNVFFSPLGIEGTTFVPTITSTTNLDTPLIETSIANYNLSSTWNDTALNITAMNTFFYFNGTRYTPTTVTVVNSSSSSLSITHGLGNGTFPTYWFINYTIVGGNITQVNTSSVNQVFNRMILSNSTGTASLRITVRDESSLALIVNVTFEPSLAVYFRTSALSRNYTLAYNSTNGGNITIYKSPTVFNITGNGLMDYDATGYETRTYFFVSQRFGDDLQDLTLYLALANTTTPVTLVVEDRAGRKLQGITVRVLRENPATGTTIVTHTQVTAYDGTVIVDLVPYAADYKFQFLDASNNLIATTPNTQKIDGSTLTFRLKLNDDFIDPLRVSNDITTSLTYNATSGKFTYTYNDPSGSTAFGCLKIERVQFSSQWELSNTCSAGSSGSVTYMHGITTEAELFATGQINLSTQSVGYVTDTLDVKVGETNFGRMGVFLGFLITATLMLLSMWAGPAAFVMGILGLGVSALWGFGEIFYSFTIAAMVLLIIWIGVRRQ